ncbi:MAG: type III pantothenate kinase, partial [Candidatus Rokuibacteriota bacterium]
LFIEMLLQSRGIQVASIDGVSISNVVPPVQQTLEWMCGKYFSRPPFFVEPGVNTRMPLAVDAPREVGADRYVDAFAAAAKYGPPLIVIDFGTATTFNCVNRRGEFIGGAIAPGIVTSVEALINRAARLSRVELVRPKEAIGRNTTTNLQSGAIYGYAGLVEGLVERMLGELGGAAKVIATGGNAGLLTDVARCLERLDENLRLDGLRMLYEETRPPAPRR